MQKIGIIGENGTVKMKNLTTREEVELARDADCAALLG